MQRARELMQVYSHNRPDGRSCFTVLTEHGVDSSASAENIAMGQRTPEEVMRGWMNSPGHRAAILGSNYNSLGVGVAIDSNGRVHWVQLFARTSAPSVTPTPSPNGTATIRYNANGGSGAPASHTVNKESNGVAYYALTMARPTRSGHTFLGWRLDNSTAYDIDSPGQSIAIALTRGNNETLTYYAQWRRN
jgi:uncharacterized repeat protein (TIGR02543 family)